MVAGSERGQLIALYEKLETGEYKYIGRTERILYAVFANFVYLSTCLLVALL